MRIGLFGINIGACARPETARAVARLAEEAGFESLWTGEHIVLPDPRVAPSPADPQTPFLHAPALLSFLAGITDTIKLATGITLVPQHNPVILAKEIATLDVLSGGRLLFGIGAGYLQPEFDALGSTFEDRGVRTDEYLDAMRALWTARKPEFSGQHVAFSSIDAQPRPVQSGGPPVIVGGWGAAAMRRTVQRGNGWFGFSLDLQQTKGALDLLEVARARYSRPDPLGPIERSVTPPVRPTRTMMEDYASLGIDRLIPMLAIETETAALQGVEMLAAELL